MSCRAVRIKGAGGVEVLAIEECERPKPEADEVLVEVSTAGLNRADCLQRRGFYPAPKGCVADIPGLEYAGTVCEIGDSVTHYSVGDRVMGICAGGAMATHIAVPARTAVAVPKNLSLEQAGAIPEVFFTAFDALWAQGGLAQGETVLIHAIGSGVGSAAVQLAKKAGATVIGTSRTKAKLARAAELGLEHGVFVEDGTFSEAVKDVERHGADLILDFVGAAYLAENLRSLARGGRLVVIGLLGGVKAELPLAVLLAKRAQIIGTVLRSRSVDEKAALAEAFSAEVLPGFIDNSYKPVIDRVMPMEQIGLAHEYLESNRSFGKVVMSWGP